MEIDSMKDLSALVSDYVLSILTSELDIEPRRSRDDEVLFRVYPSCQLACDEVEHSSEVRVAHNELTVEQHFTQCLLHYPVHIACHNQIKPENEGGVGLEAWKGGLYRTSVPVERPH